MNYSEFKAHLKRGELKPAYLFVGTEDFLIEDCIKAITGLVVEPDTREFNLDILHGTDTDGGKIVDVANAYPMLAESRLLIVKELHKLSSSSLDLVAKYLEKPAPSTKMVLTSPKADFRTKAFSKIKSHTTFVEFKPLYDSDIPKWIQAYLNKRNLKIAHEASMLIHARVGNNLRALASELDKIILNLGDKKQIEEEDVQKVVGLSRSFSVFNLNDAIGYKDLSKGLFILNQMLESGESPTGIIAMITRHFVNLMKVSGAMAQQKSDGEISRLSGIPHFFIRKSKEMARNYPMARYSQIFQRLLNTDLILKTSQQPSAIALQKLLIKIIR